MRRIPFDFEIEVLPYSNEAFMEICGIGDGEEFKYGIFHARVGEISGGSSDFVEVSLQVGDGENWAAWAYDYDIVHEGDSLMGYSRGPAHPRFKIARIRVAKQSLKTRVKVRVWGSVDYGKLVEEPSSKPPAPTEPKPPEERPPSQPEKPSEPFDVGGWIEYGLRKILRDEEPPSCFPSTTRLLVALLAMIYTAALPQIDVWVRALGLVAIPAVLIGEPWRLLTHIFLHYPMMGEVGGLIIPHAHIAMNTLFLWVFGDNVECRVGKGRYLGYFLVLGVLAGLGQVLWMHAVGLGFAEIYVVGASGAISGLMGMYLVFWPGNRVVFLGKRMSAWLFLVLWFLGQVGMLFSLGLGVAVAGHVTGFICGLVFGYAEKHGLEGLRWVSEIVRR